ncbi:hypothetical protein PsorP6_003579 [Peronosclerospora sorghi]|uniref:Uncharacterized protein n=1 Tax=Peronosclerospora sorghi TaxID=230839 RepID=A0ACC0VP31_9STRA|nr:hypothetical protein PsorP6_003579 [Peronosclerospora sorghi]
MFMKKNCKSIDSVNVHLSDHEIVQAIDVSDIIIHKWHEHGSRANYVRQQVLLGTNYSDMQDIDMIESSGDVPTPIDTEEEYSDMSYTVIHKSVEIHSINAMDVDGERENEQSHSISNSKSKIDPGSNVS